MFSVILVMVFVLGISWMKAPELFSFGPGANIKNNDDAPRYYAYTEPAENLEAQVAGANTYDGPMVINEDGSVTPVDFGEVLGAATEGVSLSLEDVKISNTVADSPEAIYQYFSDAITLEAGAINNSDFETALASQNQDLINAQSAKLAGIRDALYGVQVPLGLVKLHKLKILQYNAAAAILENFTKADENPELVGKYLQEFLKSQQDLDNENKLVLEKYNLDITTMLQIQAPAVTE